jgi:hypothetical protein
MRSALDLIRRIQQLLESLKTTDLTEKLLREKTRVCRDKIYADNLAHGGTIDDPFVNALILGNTAAYVFYTTPFEIWVVIGDERSLIQDFKSADIAMSDIEGYRNFILARYGKREPDIIVDRQIAEHWMEIS